MSFFAFCFLLLSVCLAVSFDLPWRTGSAVQCTCLYKRILQCIISTDKVK